MTPEQVILKPVILIDVMNLVFRQFYAHQNLQYDGRHTGVQFGVLKTIADLRAQVSTRIIFCWDHGVPVFGAPRPRNWREDVLPFYKSNRPKRDDDSYKTVVSQLADLHRVICWLGYSNVSVMGLEADDVIGVLSTMFKNSEILIFSTDKDYYQLLNDRVNVLVPKKEKGGFRRIAVDEVESEYGIGINRFAEYLALGGDSADNIKPMRGMGPKTAIKLIQMGADVRIPYSRQPAPFFQSKEYQKLSMVWGDIIRSHYAARIPTDWKDERIGKCMDAAGYSAFTFASLNAGQTWKSPKERADAETCFEKFLAERNMLSLLSIRRQFFNTNPGEQTCQSSESTISQSTYRGSPSSPARRPNRLL